MTTISNSSAFLRRVLLTDAGVGAFAGIVLLFAAAPLAEILALPAPLLRYAGLALLPVAALILYVASRPQPPRFGVWAIIAVNVLWTIESFLLLFSGWVHPNALGQIFIAVQALMVAGFAELEFIGLRRSAPRIAVA